MSRTINRVELLGRVGADPEMRYSQSGTAVATLRLATDRRRQNGETEADWHSVVCWGKQAEAVAEYVKKGNRLFVAGSLAQNTFETEDGQRRPPHRGARPGGRLPRQQRERQRRHAPGTRGGAGSEVGAGRQRPAPRPSSRPPEGERDAGSLPDGGGPALISEEEAMKETLPGAISGAIDPPVERAGVYDRPSARFDWEGQLEVRASAASGCRRALWYAATGHEPAPPSDEALTVMETGRALESVVLHAMQRAGWQVVPADAKRPTGIVLQLTPVVKVTGHPDATGQTPLFGERGRHRGEDPRARRRSSAGRRWGPSAATRTRWRRRRSTPTGSSGRPATPSSPSWTRAPAHVGHGGDPRGAGGARPGANTRVARSPGRALRHPWG